MQKNRLPSSDAAQPSYAYNARCITARKYITVSFVVLEFILLIGEFIFASQSKLNREFLCQIEHFRVTNFY